MTTTKQTLIKPHKNSYMITYEFQGGRGRLFMSSKHKKITEKTINEWDEVIQGLHPKKENIYVSGFYRLHGTIEAAE